MTTHPHHSHRPRGRLLPRASVLAMLGLVVGLLVPLSVSPPAQAALLRPTVVSLTFDDSYADQTVAEQSLAKAGLPATFYTTTGWVGSPGYLTRADLARIAQRGNEIGGHTVTHQDLTQVSATEAQRQICNGRATLQDWGFKPTSFAYPFASSTPAVEAIAKSCGYLTSRGLGDTRSPQSCGSCPYAETMPPPDPQSLRAPDEVDSGWTLAQLKQRVTDSVLHGGGWVVLTFHHVCAPIGSPTCPAEISTTPAVFNAFTSWLSLYSKLGVLNGVRVRTVDQAVRGYLGSAYPAYSPAVANPAPAPAAVGVNAIANPSLETPGTSPLPACFQAGGYGANTPAWSAVTPGHTGSVASQLVVSGYTDGDAKLLPTLDLGTCAPTAVPGATYDLSTWYRSSGLTQLALYYSDASGAWRYWTAGPWIAPATEWTQATLTTPPAPAGAVSISFGLAAIANGTLQTDDYSLVRRAAAPAAAAAASRSSARPQRGTTRQQRRLARQVTAGTRTTTGSRHQHALVPSAPAVRPGQRFASIDASRHGGRG